MRGASRGGSVIAAAAQAAASSRRFRLVPLRRRYVALVAATATTVACVITAPASASTQTAAARAAATTASTRTTMPRAAMASALAKKARAAIPLDSSESELCLTNDNSYCTTVDPANIALIVVTATDALIHAIDIWIQIRKGTYQGKHEKYAQIEFEDNQNGLCLADTFGDAYLANCSADGTIWLVVPHSDGAYLENRYALDNGYTEVLTADPLYNGADLYIYAEEQPGSAYWQTWSGYPSLPTA